MIFPLHLTWNLQMSRSNRTGIFILYGSGLTCMVIATLRVIQLGVDEHRNPKIPEPKWTLLWTILEGSVGNETFLPVLKSHNLADIKPSHYPRLFTRVRDSCTYQE